MKSSCNPKAGRGKEGIRKAVVSLAFWVPLVFIQPGWASYPGACRAVNYGDMVHYISLNEDQQVAHYQWNSPDVPWDDHPNAWVPLPSGFKRQDPNNEDYGEGVVVYGSVMLHYAVIWGSGSTPSLLISRYDLTNAKFLDSTLYGQQLATGGRHGYGVAAAVLSDKIYVFTSDFTLVSGDGGVNYSRLSPILPTSLGNYEPADALTFSPTEGPQKILVAFSKDNTKGALYATWDGSASLPLPSDQFRQLGNANARLRGAAMVLGTAQGPHSGAKVPCVQVFLFTYDYDYNGDLDPDEYCIRRCEYDVNGDTMTLDSWKFDYNGETIDRMRVFPWYVSSTDPLGRTVKQQLIYLHYYACTDTFCIGHVWETTSFLSDYMVPQNQDPSDGGYDWEGIPTSTTDGTDDELKIRRQYWSLIGVILGPPPFALNDLSETRLSDVANVQYGSKTTDAITHTTSWSDSTMASTGESIKVGLVSETMDLTYKHAWEGSNTQTNSFTSEFAVTCGTTDESSGNWGTHGWAIFAAPVLLVQDVKLYAYDYNVAAQSGTYLGQDLITVTAAGPPPGSITAPVTVQAVYFSLDNPGGEDDQIPGLLSGMTPFNESTDLEFWSDLTWEGLANQDWDVIYGTGAHGGAQVITVSQGTSEKVAFTSAENDIQSDGETEAVNIQAEVKVGLALELEGFRDFKAGYEGHWSSKTTTETDVSSNLQFWLHLPFASDTCPADCVSQLTVQPFLLKAKNYAAPWIPAGYSGSLPWCITWQVKSYAYKGGQQSGESPLPVRTGGTIVDGARAAGSAGRRWSNYWVEGGRMEWKGMDGSITAIPMTADTFDPALGALVSLNGHELRMHPGLGRWTRHRNVWEFHSKASANRSRLTLRLDFGRRTWSFDGDMLNLSKDFPAGESDVRINLAVNGKHQFFCDIPHQAEIDWGLAAWETVSDEFSLSRGSGSLDTEGGEGAILLKGRLPVSLPGFGDVSFVFNGHQVDIPLLSHQGIVEAFQRGKRFSFDDGGTHLTFDFGKNTWAARFSRGSFDRLMAPRWGGLRLGIKLGGTTVYAKEHLVLASTTKLRFER